MKRTAVVLCSGGLDSTTCIAIALRDGFEIVALSLVYGQRHELEIGAARRVADHFDVERHVVLDLGFFREIGGSALTADIDVPLGRSAEEMSEEIPVTYVPARNLVFLSYATGLAETSGANDVFIGVNALDYSGYPDCRPEFIRSFQETARLATKAGVESETPFRIHAPLVDLTKAEIIQLGSKLGAPFELTHSCYNPSEDGKSCGLCDSCHLRLEGFAEAGLIDPIPYNKQP